MAVMGYSPVSRESDLSYTGMDRSVEIIAQEAPDSQANPGAGEKI